jgi:hypothetical protein
MDRFAAGRLPGLPGDFAFEILCLWLQDMRKGRLAAALALLRND